MDLQNVSVYPIKEGVLHKPRRVKWKDKWGYTIDNQWFKLLWFTQLKVHVTVQPSGLHMDENRLTALAENTGRTIWSSNKHCLSTSSVPGTVTRVKDMTILGPFPSIFYSALLYFHIPLKMYLLSDSFLQMTCKWSPPVLMIPYTSVLFSPAYWTFPFGYLAVCPMLK